MFFNNFIFYTKRCWQQKFNTLDTGKWTLWNFPIKFSNKNLDKLFWRKRVKSSFNKLIFSSRPFNSWSAISTVDPPFQQLIRHFRSYTRILFNLSLHLSSWYAEKQRRHWYVGQTITSICFQRCQGVEFFYLICY